MSIKTNRKVAILTLVRSNNHGALLQAYALQSVLKIDFGLDVVLIDYEWRSETGNFLKYLTSPRKTILRINTKGVHFFFTILLSLFRKKKEISDLRYNDFRKKFLNVSEKQFNSSELMINPPSADIYIVGSDQVWAVDFYFNNRRFLLDFVPGDKIKFSYAASFGKSRIEPYLKTILKKELPSFKSISVREESGVDIVRELGFSHGVPVLDPTLLLKEEQYDKITEGSFVKSDYIFVYILSTDESLFNRMVKLIDFYNVEKLEVKYLTTNNQCRPPDDWTSVSLSTEEFLLHIKNAQHIFTNSFHGCVFSIVYQKQFTALPRDGYVDRQNLRLTNLLKNLELKSIFIAPDALNSFRNDSLNQNPIDYNLVNTHLESLRKESLEFIRNAIN